MRYYMSYLEAQAVSTFDPKGNWHPKEEETTQPPTSPRNCNYKNLQAVKTAQDENGEEGSEKQKKNLMGNERGKSTEKEKKGVNTQKRALAVYKQNAFQERCRKFGTSTWNKIPSGTETERKGKERGRDEL